MNRNYDVAVKAVQALLERRERGEVPYILTGMDMRWQIAHILRVPLDSPACDGPMRICMTELRTVWA